MKSRSIFPIHGADSGAPLKQCLISSVTHFVPELRSPTIWIWNFPFWRSETNRPVRHLCASPKVLISEQLALKGRNWLDGTQFRISRHDFISLQKSSGSCWLSPLFVRMSAALMTMVPFVSGKGRRVLNAVMQTTANIEKGKMPLKAPRGPNFLHWLMIDIQKGTGHVMGEWMYIRRLFACVFYIRSNNKLKRVIEKGANKKMRGDDARQWWKIKRA